MRNADGSTEERQNVGGSGKTEQEAEKMAGPQETHCLCGSSDESSFMICCDHCGIWYHGACLQVTRTQANRIEIYACPPCISKDSNLKIIYRAPKKEQEKSIYYERQPKAKKARNDVRTQKENKSTKGCNNCINCFRSTNCGKCTNCNVSVEPCLKRICLQSEWWNKHKKKQQQSKDIATKEEAAVLSIHPVQTRSRRERTKYTYTTDDDDDDMEAFKSEGASTRSSTAASGAKRPQRKAARKKKTTTYQRRQTNTAAGRARKEESDDEFSFTEEQRQQIAAAVYGRRSNRFESNKKEKTNHCEGPQCTNSTRAQSKFCSEECGMNLARERLRRVLPERVKTHWDNLTCSAEQTQQLRDAIEDQIQFFTNKVRIFADFQDELRKWITITEEIDTESEAGTSNTSDMDFILHCAVCALEFPAKLIVKHMERCFVRNEKQSCYGTPNKSQVNPYNIFCEQYNKANNTFCKRLRVLCSEHYKPTEDCMKICGYPFAWGESEFRPVIKTFDDMQAMLQKGFCHNRRKNCLQHHNWIQNAMGLIDVELLNLLIKLDEWFEKKRVLQVSETMRGDVLSLFCDRTTPCDIMSNEEKGAEADNEANAKPVDDMEYQNVEQEESVEGTDHVAFTNLVEDSAV